MASETLTNTNISDTYVGVLHAKGEPIPVTGLEYVYDGFGNKSSLQIGRDGQGVDFSGELGLGIINALYPVGAVTFSADDTNPQDRFTGTTWVRVAEGQFVAGVGMGTDINGTEHTVTAGDTDTAGEYEHTLTENEMPQHTHQVNVAHENYSAQPPSPRQNVGSKKTASYNLLLTSEVAGGGQSHNNLPPAFGMYVWERTA